MDPSLEQARQAFVAGIEQFERHDFEAAAALFEQALQRAPGRPSVLMNLGVSCVHLGRFVQADVCLRQALAADATLTARTEAQLAADLAFAQAEKRFEAGALDAFAYADARTRRDAAAADRLRAFYDAVFTSKILSFYLGRPLTL